MTIPLNQMQRYQGVSNQLIDAVQAHSKAKAAATHARDVYDDARRDLIRRGACGSRATADEREATLSGSLREETKALRAARDALSLAEMELETARIAERAEREALRVYYGEGDKAS